MITKYELLARIEAIEAHLGIITQAEMASLDTDDHSGI